jgi:hypothetical protein
MKKYHEFTCLFDNGENPVTGERNFETGIVCVDLNAVIAFNPFFLDGYTVLRMSDGTSFVVKFAYEKAKTLLQSNSLRSIVNN